MKSSIELVKYFVKFCHGSTSFLFVILCLKVCIIALDQNLRNFSIPNVEQSKKIYFRFYDLKLLYIYVNTNNLSIWQWQVISWVLKNLKNLYKQLLTQTQTTYAQKGDVTNWITSQWRESKLDQFIPINYPKILKAAFFSRFWQISGWFVFFFRSLFFSQNSIIINHVGLQKTS